MSRSFWITLAVVSVLIFGFSVSNRIHKGRVADALILAEATKEDEPRSDEWLFAHEQRVEEAKKELVPSKLKEATAFLRSITELVTAITAMLGAFKAMTWKQEYDDNYGL